MGQDIFEIAVNVTKLIIIFVMMVQLVPLLVWVERRGSAYIQNRFGPNRIGPLGLTQLLADAVKFAFKEEFLPTKARRFIFYAAPVIALVPGALAFGSIPLSIPIAIEPFQMMGETWGPYLFKFQSFEIGIGIVFVLGVSSLGGYALLLAGWGSENKFAMLGALRACAQMISYELALGLSLVGVLMLYQTFHFADMITAQMGPLMLFGSEIPFLPAWGVFYQPLGALIFFCAAFAETNRLPFDLPEAEGELVAGFHTEYSGFKMNLFYIGEYGHMMVASALFTAMYLGGYDIPGVQDDVAMVSQMIAGLGLSTNMVSVLTALAMHVVFFTKVLLLLWVFVWVRWTLPRFRYDQLMDLGWKTMLPWALANVIITAVVVAVMGMS